MTRKKQLFSQHFDRLNIDSFAFLGSLYSSFRLPTECAGSLSAMRVDTRLRPVIVLSVIAHSLYIHILSGQWPSAAL